MPDLRTDRLEQNQNTGHLDAAAGGACARSAEHQQYQNHFAEHRPQVEVFSTVPRCCDNRCNLKGCMMEALRQRVEQSPDVDRNHQNAHRDNQEITAHLLHPEGLLLVLPEKEIVRIEVHAERQHEDRNDPLLQRCIAPAAVVPDTEAAGSRCSEGDADRIEALHSGQKKQHQLDAGQTDINKIQNLRTFLHARHQLPDRRSRALCLHQLHVVAARHRNNGQHEDDDSHASDPVRKASPDQACMR